MLAGNAEFEALGNALGSFQKMRGGDRWTDLDRNTLEDRQPAIEMIGMNGQRQVLLHRLAMIAAAHQSDR